MSQLDWSRLLKQQDQHVHIQDQKQQERIHRLKLLYKNQLQKMIQHQRDHASDEKVQDKKLVQIADEIDKRKMMLERQQAYKKYKTKQEMAKNNLKWDFIKKQQILHRNQEDKKFYAQRFKKAKTQVQIQTRQKLHKRDHEKDQLSKAYDSQITIGQTRKKLEKLQDEKFAKLQYQIQQRKQESRQQYFERIRNGYRQNPEVYESSAQALIQKQRERQEFIKKFINQDKYSAAQIQKKKKQKLTHNKIKETSVFNRQFFQTKVLRDRYLSLQEVADYSDRYKTLQSQLMHEKEAKLQESEKKRQALKIQLQRQIDQTYMKQSQANKMSQKQYLLNRSNKMPSLPGLSKDYTAEKQHRILQKFLGGGGSSGTN